MSDVVFRRIKGRIVPIVKKENEKDFKQGVALLASGSAVSFGGAYAAGKSYKGFARSQSRMETILQNIESAKSNLSKKAYKAGHASRMAAMSNLQSEIKEKNTE